MDKLEQLEQSRVEKLFLVTMIIEVKLLEHEGVYSVEKHLDAAFDLHRLPGKHRIGSRIIQKPQKLMISEVSEGHVAYERSSKRKHT